MEHRAALGLVRRPYGTAMGLDERSDDGQAQADAAWLRAEEGIEKLRAMLSADPVSAVPHVDQPIGTVDRHGDGNRSPALLFISHGIHRVQNKVDEDLHDLDAV